MKDSTPLPEPTRLQNLRTLHYANLEGSFAAAFGALVGGNFIIGLATSLKAGDQWIGLLSAIGGIVGLLQFPGSILAKRTPSYKAYITPWGLTWRLLFLAMALVPLLSTSTQFKLTMMAVILAVAGASVNMVAATYNEWLAEMVPAAERGFFYSRRNALLTGVGALTGLVGALAFSQFKKYGIEAEGYSILFFSGVVFGLISQFLYSKMQDTPRKEVLDSNLRATFAEFKVPLKDPNFRKLLLFLSFLMIGTTFPGGFFATYALEELKFDLSALQFLGLLQALGIVIASRTWGTFVDRYGNRPILTICAAGIAVTPTMWLFTDPSRPTMSLAILTVGHLLIGFIWSGVGLCQGNIILATTPESTRGSYIGIGQTIQALCSGIGPLLGAQVLTLLKLSNDPATSYKLLFGITMGLRAFAALWLIPVREEGSRGIREAFRAVSRPSPTGFRAMRQMKQAGTAEGKTEALRAAGHKNFALATQDAIRALSDPSPKVRRQAATTLAQLGDPEGTAAIIEHIHEHPDLLEEETVEALGVLGDASAVSTLTPLLKNPSSQVRRATARALGNIGDIGALPSLIGALDERDDVEVRRASLQALRLIGSKDAAGAIIDRLLDPHPSVRIAAAEAVAELELRDAGPILRKALNQFSDEASGELAYTLGTFGHMQDLPLVLQQAAKSPSALSRRRCQLGAACILGVESELYRHFARQGMESLNKLMETVSELDKTTPGIREAFVTYADGNQDKALNMMVELKKKEPIFVLMRETPSRELFILAVLFSQGMQKSGG